MLADWWEKQWHHRQRLCDGSVTGINRVGGLVGQNGGTISNAYATGSVTGDTINVGGLVGSNDLTIGIISNSFWDTISTGQGPMGLVPETSQAQRAKLQLK